jgi:hypothetical protein
LLTGSKTTSTKSKKSRNKEKKAREKCLAGKVADRETGEKSPVNLAGGMERQVASDLAHNPEAKGRGLAERDQERKKQATRPPATSGGECSGQKTPDCS